MDKIKVVWICHFSNAEIRSKLSLSSRVFNNLVRKLFGKKPLKYIEFAPWITLQINDFKKFNDVELHVVSPHAGLINRKQEFTHDGVFYHFVRPTGNSLWERFIKKVAKRKDDYKTNRLRLKRVIDGVNPDLINLIGAENTYYSSVILDIKKYPVLLTLQTVYANPLRKKYSGSIDAFRWATEIEIFKKVKYFATGGRVYRDLVLNYNKDAVFFKYLFPTRKISLSGVKEKKEYDFVFFAGAVTAKKGIEDAIHALSIANNAYSNIQLLIVGAVSDSYYPVLQQLIRSLKLEQNITIKGYFASHTKMLTYITKARFALLPVKMDVISSAVLEAIQLKLPVVTYKTTGMPFLNKDGEAVLMAEIGNVDQLAQHMLTFIDNPKLAEQLSVQAAKLVEREFNNELIAKRLVNSYKAILRKEQEGKAIPDELTFNLDEFPVYK